MLYIRVVPGFGIAVEEAARPELSSFPLVMGGLPHQRGLVREANTTAQIAGVRPGMTLAQARQQCPETLFLVPDPARYQTLWETLCNVLRMYTPLVEPVEIGQAVCDLQGCEQLWGSEWQVACEIVHQVKESTGLAPWIGVGLNRLMAQLASTVAGADGITVIETGQERAFLANLPLSSLPELDPKLALTFQVLGLKTIGQLAALPVAAVRQRFGSKGETLHRYARGVDPRPVLPPPTKPAVIAHRECDEGTLEEVVALLQQLAEHCAAELQQRHLAGKLVKLSLIWNPEQSTGPRHLGSCSVHSTAPNIVSLESGNTLAEEHPVSFPLDYRIHSMLPQPLEQQPIVPASLPPRDDTAISATSHSSPIASGSRTIAQLAVRTPIDTAAPLIEQAQRLLLRHWPRDQRQQAYAIELEISEFARPSQLSFEMCGRLDQTGGVAGLSVERRQALVQQDELLTARYGSATFQHIAQVDPGNVLTERRFRWREGLPWEGTERARKKTVSKRA